MSWLNVFDKPWRNLPWLHPRNLKYLKSNFECAKQRITKGWCYRDWFNLDSWFETVFPELLEEFVKNHHGLPNKDYSKNPPEFIHWSKGNFTAEEEEKYDAVYRDYLLELAQHLRNAGVEWEDSELKDKYSYLEYNDYCQKELEKGLDMLKQCFFELWD